MSYDRVDGELFHHGIRHILRRSTQPVTANQLAMELEVSQRSIYRDVADLMGQRVPIRGEAGIGYVLDRDFDMPPLMLTPDELEAAVLGAQWVAERGDAVLAGAARDLISKITAVVPEHLRPFITAPSIGAPTSRGVAADGIDIGLTRSCIRRGRKIRIRYRDEQSRETERTIWPTMIGFAETVRLLAAWCELRQDFRHFRTDHIVGSEFLEEPFGCRPDELRAQWQSFMEKERAIRLP